jgi:hypothetical protein
MIAAISQSVFDASSVGPNPNTNPICGRTVRAGRIDERIGEYISIDLKVVDRCKSQHILLRSLMLIQMVGEGCAPNDIDVSPAAFDHLADRHLGRVPVDWTFL